MKFKSIELNYDLVVCGAGMSGICAAIQGARSGLKTALINNRGVLGGNAGPEIRIHVCGATALEHNLYSREGGIIGELLIENRYRNPQGNVYLWHTVLIDALKNENNCDVFLNTNIDEVNIEEGTIVSVAGSQIGTEKHFVFNGNMFIDDTGDGTIGYLSGADYMYGREARGKWGEGIAPEKEDDGVLLSSLSFYSKNFHTNMKFVMPSFAKEMKEGFNETLNHRVIPDRMPNHPRYDGYRFQWFYELGADKHQITDAEEIIYEHNQLVYNIWDHIKNESSYEANQFDLEYISPVPGKRESRRLVGEYILKEKDIAKQVHFEDAVAYGGWSIDLHAPGGFFDTDLINRHYYLRGIYEIPFRSCCVKGINNLMVASRCLSVSHVASGTTRIMSTLSLLGQACGLAAALCKKYSLTPKEVGEQYITELQEELQKLDQGIIGVKKKPSLVNEAKITASSCFEGTIEHTDMWMKFNKTRGLVVPVSSQNKQFKMYINAIEDTTLKYSIYKPAKKENFGPEILLGEYEIPVEKVMDGIPTIIDLSNLEYEDNIFIYLDENDKLEFEYTMEMVNGYRMHDKNKNPSNTFYDIETLECKEYLWDKIDILPVFEYKTDIYDVSNLTNGYIRNYGHPNIWLSSRCDKEPEILIEFDKAKPISKMEFIFDNLCDDIDYDTLETIYESNVWKQVVKSYEVYGYNSDSYKLIGKITNNYQRRSSVELVFGNYSKLKVKILETNGDSKVGIYDMVIM